MQKSLDFLVQILYDNQADLQIQPAQSKYDPLAQSVEHLTFNQGVRSSNLRRVTIFAFAAQIAGVAELADALDLGSSAAQAYEFKSLRPHQKQNIMRV